jgi:hypothetical protein
MQPKVGISLAVVFFGGSAAYADTGCDPALIREFQESERIVVSLRADKPAQFRVFAVDGSEFTVGQSRWMRGQLEKSGRARARGDCAEAAKLLGGVHDLIKAHAKS